jgi:GGDEF domain-containing protein
VVAGEQNLTASSGYAIYPDGGRTADELIGAADDALKREKRARQPVARGPQGTEKSPKPYPQTT